MATKAENKERLEKDLIEFTRRRYKLLTELALLPRNAPQSTAFTNLENWLGQCAAELSARLDDVDAALTDADADNITLNTAGLEASDPNLTIRDFVKL